jgi:hypothetical protein
VENNSPLHAINFYLLASVQAMSGSVILANPGYQQKPDFLGFLQDMVLDKHVFTNFIL